MTYESIIIEIRHNDNRIITKSSATIHDLQLRPHESLQEFIKRLMVEVLKSTDSFGNKPISAPQPILEQVDPKWRT